MSAQSRPLFEDGGEWILNAIKRNPEGLLLLGAGAVLLMRTNSPKSSPVAPIKSEREELPGAEENAASDMAEAVTDFSRRTMDAASETARSYASSAAEYAGQAKCAVEDHSAQAVRQARSVAQGVLQNQPLVIVAAGLAAGAALAAAFPPTDLEKEALGPLADQVSTATERFGDQLKQATADAGHKLKTAADERGLRTETLKEVAGEVVDTFKASMTGPAAPTQPGRDG